MKASGILITGALAVLAIAVSSCANSGTQSTPATPAAVSVGNPSPPPVASAAKSTSVPVSIAQYFNDQGIYPDGVQFTNGIDRDGWACSSNALAGQTWNGVPFEMGSAGNGTNVITCAGQTIAVAQPGHVSKLEILALAVNGAQENQDFTVNYADGSNKAFTQSLSDWAGPDSYPGESVAITMNYRDQSDGTKDDNAYYIYSYTFDVDSSKTLQGLKLPDNDNVKVFALALVP